MNGNLPWLILFIVALFGNFSQAQGAGAEQGPQADCSLASSSPAGIPFTAARQSILNGCHRSYSSDERFYMAGHAQSIVDRCGIAIVTLPEPLRTFLFRSAFSGVSNPSYIFGNTTFTEGQCGTPAATRWLQGVQASLAMPEEAKRPDGSTTFVDSCEVFYRGKWSKEKCVCLADVGRLTIPSIDTKYFGMDIMKDLRPQSGVLVARCGITDYSQPPAPPQSQQSARFSACHRELRAIPGRGTRTPEMVQELLKECMNRADGPSRD